MIEDEFNTFINLQASIQTIEELVEAKRLEYLAAVFYNCNLTGLELETAAELIKKNAKLKDRVIVDAEGAGYFPKTANLPI